MRKPMLDVIRHHVYSPQRDYMLKSRYLFLPKYFLPHFSLSYLLFEAPVKHTQCQNINNAQWQMKVEQTEPKANSTLMAKVSPVVFFLAKNTLPKAPLLIGFIISKSSMHVLSSGGKHDVFCLILWQFFSVMYLRIFLAFNIPSISAYFLLCKWMNEKKWPKKSINLYNFYGLY